MSVINVQVEEYQFYIKKRDRYISHSCIVRERARDYMNIVYTWTTYSIDEYNMIYVELHSV